jgi:hypothetical protein
LIKRAIILAIATLSGGIYEIFNSPSDFSFAKGNMESEAIAFLL